MQLSITLLLALCSLIVLSLAWGSTILLSEGLRLGIAWALLTLGGIGAVAAYRHNATLRRRLSALEEELQRTCAGQEDLVRCRTRELESALQQRRHGESENARLRDHFAELAREQTAAIKSIVETAPDAILTLDASKCILAFNPAAEQMFGWRLGEVAGRGIHELLERRDNPLLEELDDTRSAAPGVAGVRHCEGRGRRRNGQLFPVEMSVSRVKLGADVHHTVILRDITVVREAHRALEQSRAMLRQVIDLVPNMVFAKDHEGRFLFANKAVVNAYGITADAIVGRLHRELHHDAVELQAMLDMDHEVMQSGQVRVVPEESFTDHLGHRHYYHTTKIPFDWGSDGRLGVLGVKVDITEQRHDAEKLRSAKEAAEAANMAKSMFLANMSHEIRTPMNAIIGMTELLMETDLNTRQRRLLDAVIQAARALLGLLDGILDLSRLEGGQMTFESIPFDLRSVLGDVLELSRGSAERKALRLELQVNGSVPPCVRGDPGRLRQVLLNLVGNAIKFTASGAVRVILEPAQGWQGGWHFRVEDTGIGIAPDRLEKIFERFTQAEESTSRRFGGSGLGTAICREIVEAQGGRIWARSEPGQGSVFHFVLPMPVVHDPDECMRAPQSPRLTRLPRIRPLAILLAEDVPANQELMVRRLEEWGHRVVVVPDGQQVLERLEQGGIDLVLMDLMMPRMDGCQAARQIRAAELAQGRSRTPIIAISASVGAEDRRAALESGMDAFFPKPIDFQELFSHMAQMFPCLSGPEGAKSKEAGPGETTGEALDGTCRPLLLRLDAALTRGQLDETALQSLAGCMPPGKLASLRALLDEFELEQAHAWVQRHLPPVP
ncbi:MAG: PAS domain S-box protein [Magnetococcus sp. WYHC-3]